MNLVPKHHGRRMFREANCILTTIKISFSYMDSKMCRVHEVYNRSKLGYAPTVWSPYVRSHIELMERMYRNTREVSELSRMNHEDLPT